MASLEVLVPLAVLAFLVVGTARLVREGSGVAYGLGILILLTFGAQVAGPFFLGGDVVGGGLALVTARLLEGSGWWTPFSYMFVHAGLEHLIGNLFILLTVGPLLEARIGARRFLLIYFVAGFAAAAAHVVLTLAGVVSTVFTPAVGASGAIFGVLTAFAVRHPRDRIPIPLFFIIWLPAFVVLLVYLAMNVVYMFGDTNAAWWGHFAGFLVGLAWATRLQTLQPVRRSATVDVDALKPLATNRTLESTLERLRQFEGGAKTQDDPEFADAWLTRFFQQAACPRCGGHLHREGLKAECERGDYQVKFAKRPTDEPAVN